MPPIDPQHQTEVPPASTPAPGVDAELRKRRWPVFVILGLFLLIALPLIASGNMGGRGAQDQLQFHWPTVRAFAREWPIFNFSDYRSATTPGYHVYLATIARFIHDAPRVLQLGSCAITVVMLWVLAWACSRHAPAVWWKRGRDGPLHGRGGLALVFIHLPLITSVYTLSPGIWLQPDHNR